MVVPIDRAGRVDIPKDIRDGLGADAEVEVEVEVEGWPVIERGDGPAISDADVQRWRDAEQR